MSADTKQRSEIDNAFKWKITDLYESDEQWQKDYDEVFLKINEIDKYKGCIDIGNLFDCLALNDKLGKAVETLYVYANLRSYEDSTNTFYQALADKADGLIVKYSSAVSFIQPQILTMDESKLRNAAANTVYVHYIDDLLRSKEHILSAEKEELLAQIYEIEQAPESIFSMLNNADISFKPAVDKDGNEQTLTHGKYSSYLEAEDRKLRKSAFEAYYDAYYKQKNTIAAIYSYSVKKDNFNAHIRNYSSALEAALSVHNIPTAVYTNLIDVVSRNLKLMHRYIKMRKKFLGVDKLHFYDVYTPLVKETNRKADYKQAKELVLNAMKPLGRDYISKLSEALESGWVDIYENVGKRSGAYAWGAYGCHPFVSLNYDDTVNSVFTLAHEMGHAMHSNYTWSSQPYTYGDYTIFVAEVASTVNESLLMNYMLGDTADEKQKAYLLNYFMEQFRGTLFRQTMFAEFELKTHEAAEAGTPLTFDYLCELYRTLNMKYYGEAVEYDNQISWEWSRIPHFYSPFYVYQYATGYSAAIALSDKILNDDGAENYIKFLKAGSSDYSINLLKIAGVDMSTQQPIENAMSVFEKLLDKMEEYY